MARTTIAATVAAGNAVDATIYTVPANYQGVLGNLTVVNPTGGGLNFTFKLTRLGTDYTLISANTVNATSANQYAKGASIPICPITVQAGDILKGQGSGAGLIVILSGIIFST